MSNATEFGKAKIWLMAQRAKSAAKQSAHWRLAAGVWLEMMWPMPLTASKPRWIMA